MSNDFHDALVKSNAEALIAGRANGEPVGMVLVFTPSTENPGTSEFNIVADPYTYDDANNVLHHVHEFIEHLRHDIGEFNYRQQQLRELTERKRDEQ